MWPPISINKPTRLALTSQSHDYKRHGTTTLFAALEVATVRIIAAHSKRRRRDVLLVSILKTALNGLLVHGGTAEASDWVRAWSTRFRSNWVVK
jgi:hypothetical protein